MMIGEISIIDEFFDKEFYRNMNSDLSELSEDELLLHYYHIGWREGRWPNNWFDQETYLEQHPCLKEHQVNPLLHYVLVKKCTNEED